MQKRKFTVVTQLHEKNNHDIIEYVESSRSNVRAKSETVGISNSLITRITLSYKSL